MTTADENADLPTTYAQLLAINAAEFAGGRFETAYHSLVAALHCAHDMGDVAKMREVDRVATDQMNRLETSAEAQQSASPAQMQVQADARRTLLNVYASLCRQASSMAEMQRHRDRQPM